MPYCGMRGNGATRLGAARLHTPCTLSRPSAGDHDDAALMHASQPQHAHRRPTAAPAITALPVKQWCMEQHGW